jgi:hypothetical protein
MSTSFWAVETPTSEENIGNFAMSNDIEPIPNKTQVLAYIDEIKWDAYEDSSYISARWNIIKPVEYKNRKIFQKIRANDNDQKKKEKAIKMLMAIDYNAKGGLASSGKEPTTEIMQNKLTNKPMVIMLQVWELEDRNTGEMKKGNWISAVAPKGDVVPEKVVPVVRETRAKTIEEEASDAFPDNDTLGF